MFKTMPMLDDMMPQPLDDYRLFASTDIEDTRRRVADVYCDHRLTPIGRCGRIDAWQNGVRLKHISLGTIGYGADVEIDPGKLDDFYLLMLPYAGEAMIDAGGRTARASSTVGTILTPHDRILMRWSGDCAKYMIRIERSVLEQQAAMMLGRPLRASLNFQLAIPREGAGANWWRMAKLLISLVEHRDTAAGTLAIQQIESALIAGLLEGHANTYSDMLRTRDCTVAPRHVKLAEQYIEEHAAECIDINDLIRVSGVSGRALYEGFRRFRDVSPMAHLRQVRMYRARGDLLDPDNTLTVSRIACEWGFSELGRFAGRYRELYGETPSQTLRRCRRSNDPH